MPAITTSATTISNAAERRTLPMSPPNTRPPALPATAPDTPPARALWEALGAAPEATTTTDLAATAEIGRSTATKLLAPWAESGVLIREPGGRPGGRRLPDRWAIARPAVGAQTKLASRGRLRGGQLRTLVLDYLRAHPGGEFSTTGLGHALDRSPGAIFNACQRLLTDGAVSQTSQRPRRYQAARPDRTEESESKG